MTDMALKKIVREYRDGILGARPSWMMCFAVCAPLQSFLSTLCDIDTLLVSSDFFDGNHVWLEMLDGRIIDPTADQYGLPPVYIGPLPVAYKNRSIRLMGLKP